MAEIDKDSATAHVTHGGIHDHQVYAPGLTKRELFAAMAMQGYCTEGVGGNIGRVAAESVHMADALLKELSQQSREGGGK